MELQRGLELELQRGAGSGELGERLRCLEDYSRKNNLIIDGIPEPSGETTETLQSSIQRLFNEKLKLKPEIDNVHRIGSKGNKSDNRPRSVIIRMTKFHHRQECLKSAPKLKGTDIYINEDVCKATLEIRKSKIEELKLKRRQGYIAYFAGTDIVVKKRMQNQQRNGDCDKEDHSEVDKESYDTDTGDLRGKYNDKLRDRSAKKVNRKS